MEKIFVFLTEHWVRFLVSFLIGLLTAVIFLAVNNGWVYPIHYVNGAFIGGAVLLGTSALTVLNLYGAFDIFSFYFSRKKKEDGKKEVLYEYSERKRLERGRFKLVFVPYLINAVIFLVVAVILRFTVM